RKMRLQRGLLPRDHQHAVLLIADADFPDIWLRAHTLRQRGDRSGSNRQFQKFPTLHHDLLMGIPRFQRDHSTPEMMVLPEISVECSAKIAMTTLLNRTWTM